MKTYKTMPAMESTVAMIAHRSAIKKQIPMMCHWIASIMTQVLFWLLIAMSYDTTAGIEMILSTTIEYIRIWEYQQISLSAQLTSV